MRWVDMFRVRLRSLVSRSSVDRELDEELQYHLDRQIAENTAAGMAPKDARLAALRSIDGLQQRREECRDMRGWNLLDNLWKDDGTVTAGAEGWKYMDANNANDTGLLLFILRNYTVDPVCKKNGGPVKPFDGSDNCLSPAEGALWNAMLLSKDLYAQNDGSYGTHNPFFYEALLSSTISALRVSYPQLPAISTNVEQIMAKALSRPGVSYVRQAPVASR